jgi:hypothetical protein
MVRALGGVGILNFHADPAPIVFLGGVFWLAHVWIVVAVYLSIQARARGRRVGLFDGWLLGLQVLGVFWTWLLP